MKKCCVIIVCYYPAIPNLEVLCGGILAQGYDVVLVNNSPEIKCTFGVLEKCIVLDMPCNVGIACAQNHGIRYAMQNEYEAIAFFDQDSCINDTLMSELLANLDPNIPNVVAPVFYDSLSGVECPSFCCSWWGRPKKVFRNNRVEPYPVDFVISSGTVATVGTFHKTGLMKEALFMDFVDLDWCLRCRNLHIPIHVVPFVTMKHSIGDSRFTFLKINNVIHSATRTYYKVRAPFLVFRYAYTPKLYALYEILSALVRNFLNIFFVEKKRVYLRAYIKGVRDGVMGIGGKASFFHKD